MERFAFAIPPLFVKYFLYAMIGTIVFVTILLFIVLIVHKVRIERRERLLAELQEKYMVALSRKLLDPALGIERPMTVMEFEALGNALIDMGVNITGRLTAQLRTIARETGMDSYYLKMTQARAWTKRYRAVEKLGFLKFPELETTYSAILDKEKDLHVIAKTIWALSLIGTEENLSKINRFLSDPLFTSAKFKEYIYSNVIRAFRERGEEDAFVSWFSRLQDDESVPLALKKVVIEACGEERLIATKEAILALYGRFREVTDMKIACIRALESLGGEEARAVIAAGLQDEDWRVRAVAAKNADVCADGIVEVLEKVLHDKSYHVRINAAHALARLGERGVAVLRSGTHSDDRFVRDVTNYILGEKAHA